MNAWPGMPDFGASPHCFVEVAAIMHRHRGRGGHASRRCLLQERDTESSTRELPAASASQPQVLGNP
jgi:hypothetical protein